MQLNSMVKHVFQIVGAVLLAMILYQLFFGVNDSALKYACEKIEEPISFYYYAYSYYPSAHNLDGVTRSLDPTHYESYSTTMLETNSLYGNTKNTDNSSVISTYSQGWY